MELNQIRYFISAAHYNNLSKAARILNITQPTLSKSISNLEEELGIKLFDRFGKKIRLNECGKRFLENAENSVQELENAVAAAKNRTAGPSLYLGLFLHSDRFMRCLGDFSKANPDLSFQADHLSIASRNVDINEFDMLLYPGNPLFQKYKGYMIYSDPYYLAVHKSDRLAGKDVAHLADVSGRKVIFIKNDGKLFDLPYHMCINSGIRISAGIFTNSPEVQRLLISDNCGVGFVPKSESGVYAADPDTVLLDVDEGGLSRDIMIGFKREKHLSAEGRRFSAFVRDHFGI
ncbi:MAG: LysR family transcriptional regulator [Oscillospiraceae bacterium]|nr:LysR family transcriptional regulator [Oscillospiraceae bacterium]